MEPQSPSSDARVIVMMTRVATTASLAVEAIGAQRFDEARQRIDRLRTQWSTLMNGDTRQLQARQTHVHTGSGVEAVQHGTEVLAICNQVITDWTRSRYEAVAAQGGQTSADGWQIVLDHVLPLAWNFQCDILVVHGRLPDELAQAIHARGQRRTVFLGPAPQSPCGPGIAHLADAEAVNQYVAGIRHSLPKHCVSLDLGEGVVSAEQVIAANELVSRAIQNLRMNWNTWRQMSTGWLEQGLRNLPAIASAPDLDALGARYAGRPAIVISPGPSLAGNIEWLRQAQGKALLLAPLQVLRRLHREGIRPDFALVLDAQDQTQGLLDFLGGIDPAFMPDLLASTCAHPNVLRAFPRVHFFASLSPIDHLMAGAHARPMPAFPAGSVSISGFKLALHWGCSPIMLVGQDLAFSGNQRYAASAGSASPIPAVTRSLPGYHGGTVQTAPDYFLFHHQFEEIAAVMHRTQPALRLLNCTEGGACIGGFEQVPLRDALAQHVNHLPVLAHPSTLPDGGPVPGLREGLARCLRASLAQVRDALRLVGACDAAARKARTGGSTARRRLTQLDTALRTQVGHLKPAMQESVDEIDDALTAWEAFDDLEAYMDGSRRYREAARTGLLQLEAMLAPALDRLVPPPTPHREPDRACTA